MSLIGKITALVFSVLVAQSLSAKKIEFKIQEDRKLVAIIDAGSSGSRLFIFQYQDKPAAGRSRVVEIVNHKVDPGLSKFDNNLSGINAYLTDILNGIKKKLSEYNNINKTQLSINAMPLYLLATAGMRNISAPDRDAILASVAHTLGKSELNFKVAQTLTGTEEGIFAWTAANFNQPTNELLGIVEIGGASAQVVFPFSGNNPHAFTIALRGKDYKLYAYSYPKGGENESAKRIISHNKNNFEALCTTSVDAQRPTTTFDECVNLIVDTFKNQCDNKTLCQSGWSNEAMQPSIEANTSFTFAGIIGAAKRIVNDKNKAIPLNQETLREAGFLACQMTTSDIIAKKAIKPRYAPKACFQSALSYAMLYGNVGIANAQGLYTGVGLSRQVSLVESKAPGPEWTIGFVIFHEFNGQIN